MAYLNKNYSQKGVLMNGLMMDSQLTITSIMEHAERLYGDGEIVSVTADNPLHRYTYKDAFS